MLVVLNSRYPKLDTKKSAGKKDTELPSAVLEDREQSEY